MIKNLVKNFFKTYSISEVSFLNGYKTYIVVKHYDGNKDNNLPLK